MPLVGRRVSEVLVVKDMAQVSVAAIAHQFVANTVLVLLLSHCGGQADEEARPSTSCIKLGVRMVEWRGASSTVVDAVIPVIHDAPVS